MLDTQWPNPLCSPHQEQVLITIFLPFYEIVGGVHNGINHRPKVLPAQAYLSLQGCCGHVRKEEIEGISAGYGSVTKELERRAEEERRKRS
jgi:hypothetical protein